MSNNIINVLTMSEAIDVLLDMEDHMAYSDGFIYIDKKFNEAMNMAINALRIIKDMTEKEIKEWDDDYPRNDRLN